MTAPSQREPLCWLAGLSGSVCVVQPGAKSPSVRAGCYYHPDSSQVKLEHVEIFGDLKPIILLHSHFAHEETEAAEGGNVLEAPHLVHLTTIYYLPTQMSAGRLSSSLGSFQFGFHSLSSLAPPAHPYLKWIKLQHINRNYSCLGTFPAHRGLLSAEKAITARLTALRLMAPETLSVINRRRPSARLAAAQLS